MDSVARKYNARDIDCSRGDIRVNGFVLGMTPDSPGGKGRLGRMSVRLRQQELGEVVGESGNCSF
jgi:hypothetical protein